MLDSASKFECLLKITMKNCNRRLISVRALKNRHYAIAFGRAWEYQRIHQNEWKSHK